MNLRTNLGRSLDLGLASNRAVVLISSVVGIYMYTQADGFIDAVWAGCLGGIAAFLGWAITRDLAPDQPVAASIAAVGVGMWLALGLPASNLLMLATLIIARLTVGVTGRWPLTSDLVIVAGFSAAIAFTPPGWAMGFGIAVAIFVDASMSARNSRNAVFAAIFAVIGGALVALLTDGLPQGVPQVDRLLLAATVTLGLLAAARTPEAPTSLVDRRGGGPVRRDRVHTGRAVVGVFLGLATLVAGAAAREVFPSAIPLAVALMANEHSRIRSRLR